MSIIWSQSAWEDYVYWQTTDKTVIKRINSLIKDITRNPLEGIGDPEPLRHNWTGYWSRRINREHRLIYKVKNDELLIAQCRYHY